MLIMKPKGTAEHKLSIVIPICEEREQKWRGLGTVLQMVYLAPLSLMMAC